MGIEELLQRVRKPARYIGGEFGSVAKPEAEVRVALAYPDLYEIGMSYLGLRILYFMINSMDFAAAERVFMPDADMVALLKEKGVPIFSLETRSPLRDFDLVSFSLLYELNYTNVLKILELGGIPIRREERRGKDPLIGAGGPNVVNPEPMAEFFDFFFFGDGEIFFPKALEIFRKIKDRGERLEALKEIKGVYVPDPSRRKRAKAGHYFVEGIKIEKAIVKNLDDFPFPERAVLPHVESVFDRQGWEISRGCPQKCRFCQATQFYSPFRARSLSEIANGVIRSLKRTGYEEVSFSSLSAADFPHFHLLLKTLYPEFKKWAISVSLPSLRPSILQDPGLLSAIADLRKTSFTIVPEAGSERLRRVINKATTGEEIIKAAEVAFSLGWRRLKFYFMIGLPTEKEEDLRGIASLLEEISSLGRKRLGSRPLLVASISNFVPMPWTPFQWEGFEDMNSLAQKQRFILNLIKKHRNIRVNFHELHQSLLEAFLARGDFRAGEVLEEVRRRGGMLEAWREHFDFSLWQEAFSKTGISPEEFTGPFPLEEPLPWDHMEAGPLKEYLLLERKKALEGERTPSCLELYCGRCKGCIYWKVARKRFSPKIELRESLPSRKEEGRYLYRIYYAKKGIARFLSQTELLKTIERIFRRTATPLSFSRGFHPKPRISLGPALPIGAEGEREIMEVETVQKLGEEFLGRWNSSSIDGLRFLSLEEIERKGIPHLRYAIYRAPAEERERIEKLGFEVKEKGQEIEFIHDLKTPSPHRRALQRGMEIKIRRTGLKFELQP